MKTKKLLSFVLAIAMIASMMATLGITASAKPATDQYIKVGETQVIRAEGIYSSETADGNYYYISVADVCTPSVLKNNISIESVDQDGNEMVITIKGVAVTDEDETVDILAKVYREDESDWVDAAIQCGYHVVPAEDTEYLDLDENTTEIYDKKEIDQNYQLTVTDNYTDMTKVKVEWTVTDINATRKDAKVWNPDTLSWVDDNENDVVTPGDTTASFKITNLSTVKVDAKVEFAAVTGFTPEVVYTGVDATTHKTTVNTVVKADKSVDSTITHDVNVTVKVTPAKADFATKSATTTATKYGTYTVTITKSVPMITITFTSSNSHSTVSYNGTDYSNGESFSIDVAKNSTVTVTGAGTALSTLTVDGKTVTQTATAGWMALWTVSNGATLTESMTINSSSCILSGSKITLADGSTKLIDDVTTDDKLMTFNFYDGKLDGNYPMYVMKHENVVASVITVTLDNGTVLEMCDWQQFFDMDEKTYFDIDTAHYKEAVGRNVLFVENGNATTARITKATMEVRNCTSYEIFTEYNKNFVANGILTVEPETYLDGVYTIGDDLKIDMEQYRQDVEAYGRYTYEEFESVMTEEEFIKMNIADKKIATGKGTVSEEWLFDLYKTWTPMYR